MGASRLLPDPWSKGDPVEIALIVLGVGLLLAAILGGGVEVLTINIPTILKLWGRIAVGVLGALLFCAGGWIGGLFGPPPGRRKLIAVGVLGALLFCAGGWIVWWRVNSRVDSPVDSPVTPEGPIDTPVPVATMVGTVTLSHHVAEFSERHTDYTITASASSTGEFSASLDAQGQFRIEDVPEKPPHTVSWGVSQPSRFVIWPLAHPRVPAREELRGFRFQRLADVFGNERRRMLEAVASGNFGDADKRLTSVLQLFERLGFRTVSNDDPVADQVRRWRFTVHRHLADAANEFRARLGRSQITDQQVQIERKWRRTMINAALEQAAPGQSLRDFARAANSWSNYARQVFSRGQQSWPDRSLASRETGEEFLRHGSYADPLLEDIALLREKLMTSQIRMFVEENANRPGLCDGQRLAVDSFSFLVEQDPESVSLNRFVNLLGTLHQLVVPARLARSKAVLSTPAT